MTDTLEKIGESAIQHGKLSDRIYLMKLTDSDMPGILPQLDGLAAKNDYTKIFAKVPEHHAAAFAEAGYLSEAEVPGYFNGGEGCHFMGKFLADQRRETDDRPTFREILKLAAARQEENRPLPQLPAGDELRQCDSADAEEMAKLYGEVFASYPFPIYDPAYIKETMESHIVYFGVWSEGRLLALASSEMEPSVGAVEMTDFATHTDGRGRGYAKIILDHMEEAMRARKMQTAYTIARAVSHGMNFTFADLGYEFTGTLINNTNIAGRLESMHVWYKPL